MIRTIEWPIEKKDMSVRRFPIKFSLKRDVKTLVYYQKIKTKGKEKITKKRIEVVVPVSIFGSISKEEIDKLKVFSNIKRVRFTAQIPFHCCDGCGAGFGLIDYPDGKFETLDEKPIKYKGGEFCDSCYERRLKKDELKGGD